MAIRVPKTIAFYGSLRSEPKEVFCWIPESEFDSMIKKQKVPADIRRFYPDGLEIPVSKEAFDMEGINLGVAPEMICQVYKELRQENLLYESGIVDGNILIQLIQQLTAIAEETPQKDEKTCYFLSQVISKKVIYPEPAMIGDERPEEIFQRLVKKK
jgi:hypothetical protein